MFLAQKIKNRINKIKLSSDSSVYDQLIAFKNIYFLIIEVTTVLLLIFSLVVFFFFRNNYQQNNIDSIDAKPNRIESKSINPRDTPEFYFLSSKDLAIILDDMNDFESKNDQFLPYYHYKENLNDVVLFKSKNGIQKYVFNEEDLSVWLYETTDNKNWIHKATSTPIFEFKEDQDWTVFDIQNIKNKSNIEIDNQLTLTQEFSIGNIEWIFGIEDENVVLKNTFVLNSPLTINRMRWEIISSEYTKSFDEPKEKNQKYLYSEDLIVNWEDFKENTVVEMKDQNKSANIFFYKEGIKGDLIIDPTFATSVVGSYIQVYDGTRWWCFGPGYDSGTSQEFFQPGRFYHSSTGAPTNCTTGGDNLLPGDRTGSQANYDQWVDPSGAIAAGATNVLRLLESTSTRTVLQVSRNTTNDSYSKYTVYPNGYNFINYEIGTATGATTSGYFIHYDASNTAPQVADNNTTNRSIVFSDTSNNNYAGMSIIPFRQLDLFYVTEFDASTTYDYYGWYSLDGNNQIETNVGFNYLLDTSNYRATTTTRDNKRVEFQAPDDISDGLNNLLLWDQFGEQNRIFYTGFEGGDSNLCDGGDSFTSGSCAGTETFVGNYTANVFMGNYSARFVGDGTDTDNSYTRYTIPSASRTRRNNLRFAFRINAETLGNSQAFAIANYRDSGGTDGIVYVNQNSSGVLNVCVEAYDGWYTCGSTALSIGTWYNLEFENAGAGATGYNILSINLNGIAEVSDSSSGVNNAATNTSFEIGVFSSDTAQNDVSFDNVSFGWVGQSIIGHNPSEGAYTMDVEGWPEEMSFDIDRNGYSETSGLAFLFRKWKTLSVPAQVLLEDVTLAEGTNFNTDLLPVSEAWINDSDGTCGTSGWLLIADGGLTSDTDEYLGDPSDNLNFGSTSSCTWGDNSSDAIYFGRNDRFSGLNVLLATLGAGDSTTTWEYCSANTDFATACDTWSTLTVNNTNTGVSNFTGNGHMDFTMPPQWIRSTENSGRQGMFFVRARVTSGSYSTYPVEAQIKSDILAMQYLNPINLDDQTFTLKTTVPEVASWKMDEGYGSTLNDDTGKGYNLTISGATWTKDSNSGSLRETYINFDGTNDSLSKTSATSFNFGVGSFSISGWFRHSSSISGTDTIFSKASAVDGIGYKIYMNSSGNICFGIDDVAGSFPSDFACTNGSYSDSSWHNVTVVKNSVSAIYLYIDGILVSSDASISSLGYLDSGGALYLGIDADGSSNPWSGSLDDFVVYSYALTSTQVKSVALLPETTALFGTSSNDDFKKGLVGWWKMDEISGDLLDSSGNNYTLTNNNSVSYVNGKFGNGTEYVPASSQYFSTIATINNVQTVSMWINPDSNTNYYWALTSGAYLTSSSGTLTTTGLNNAIIYVNDIQSNTVLTDTWQQITITFDAINTSQIYIGRQDSNYYDGTIDELRFYNRKLSFADVKDLFSKSPGPNAYYDLNENSGTTTVYDKSGNGNDGTINGSMTSNDWIPGKFGSALEFDGVNDFVQVADNNSIDMYGNLTVASWIKLNSTPSANAFIVDKRESGTNWKGYAIYIDGTLNTHAVFMTQSGTSLVQAVDTTVLSLNRWYHIETVYDRFGNITLYRDGVVVATGDISSYSALNQTTTTVMNIGYKGPAASSGTYFPGSIDDLKIYQYARTPSQIIEDMNGGHPVGGSPIGSQVGYWKFDEGYGGTAYDSSPNGNNLTLNNSPTYNLSGKYNSALNIVSTSSQFASISDNTSLSITGSLTLSSWIYPNSVASTSNYLIMGKDNYYLTQIGDELRFYVGSSSNYATSNNANLLASNWYQVTGVYNSDTQTVSLYVNGILQPSTVTGTIPSSISNGTSAFWIGGISALAGSGGPVESITETLFTANTTAHAVNMPTTVNSGDLLITFFSNDGSATVTTPSGWNLLWSTPNSTALRGSGYYRIADGTEDSTTVDFVTSAIERASAQVFRISSGNWNNTGTIGDGLVVGTAATGGSTTPDSPNLSTGWGSQDVLWISNLTTNSGVAVNGYPSDFSGYDGSDSTSGTNGVLLGTMTRRYTASSLDPSAYTLGSSALWVGQTIGIRLTMGASNVYYDGRIDESKIYSSALTSDQVKIESLQGKSALMGGLSTDSSGNSTSSKDRSYCIPGDSTTCRGPVLEWNFNENTGGYAEDTSGGGYRGTLTSGPAWRSGKIGSALSFDGADDYVVATTSTSINNLPSLTYEAWIYPTGWGEGNFGRIIDKDNGANTINMFVLLNNTGQQSFRFYRGRGTTDTYADAGNNSITLNQWQHVAVSYDSTSFVRLYINGREVTSYSQQIVGSGALNSDSGVNFFVGNRLAQDRSFQGLIDQVKVFDYAKTPEQIAWAYNYGGPLAWYKFDECSGTTINDSVISANGTDGVLDGTFSPGASGVTSAGTCTSSGSWYNGASGRYNASLSFDGDDDYVSLGSPDSLDNMSVMTLTAWINPDTFGESNFGRIMDKDSGAASAGYALFLDNGSFCSGGGNRLAFLIPWSTGPNGRGSWCTAPNSINTSVWTHVAVSYNRGSSSNDPVMYLNGIAVPITENEAPSGTVANDAANNLYIGNRPGTDRTFDGRIDDLRIYGYILNETQIKEVFNNGAVTFR